MQAFRLLFHLDPVSKCESQMSGMSRILQDLLTYLQKDTNVEGSEWMLEFVVIKVKMKICQLSGNEGSCDSGIVFDPFLHGCDIFCSGCRTRSSTVFSIFKGSFSTRTFNQQIMNEMRLSLLI